MKPVSKYPNKPNIQDTRLIYMILVIITLRRMFLKEFFIFYFCFRASPSEFIVSVNKYLEARNHKVSVGMRFKMRFEGDEAPERRYLCSYHF